MSLRHVCHRTVPTPLVKRQKPSRHSATPWAWKREPGGAGTQLCGLCLSQRMLRTDLPDSISTVTRGQKVLEGV